MHSTNRSYKKLEVYRIENVLQRKENNGVKEIYVKWKGYSNDFNSWIPTVDLAATE